MYVCVIYIHIYIYIYVANFYVYVKDKAIPKQACTCPYYSSSLKLTGGKFDSPTHQPPLPQVIALVLISFRG